MISYCRYFSPAVLTIGEKFRHKKAPGYAGGKQTTFSSQSWRPPARREVPR